MKLKHKITIWALLLFALLSPLSSLVGLGKLGSQKAAAVPPISAPTTIVSPQYYCTANIQQGKSNFLSNNIITDSTAQTYLQLNVPAGTPYNTLNAKVINNQPSVYVSFSDDNNANWKPACKSSLVLYQSVSNPGTFYGLEQTSTTSVGIEQYEYVSGSLAYNAATPSASRLTFTLKNGSKYSLQVNGISSIPSVLLPGSGGGGGGGGGGTIGTGISCLSANSSTISSNIDAYKACLKSLHAPSFTDAATIDFGGETYIASNWSGKADPNDQYMFYYLASTPDSVRKAANLSGDKRPYFALDVSQQPTSGIDVNVDNKGSLSDIQNLDAAYNGIASGKYGSVTLHYHNKDRNGVADPQIYDPSITGASLGGLRIVANYYPGDGTSDKPPTVQLVWPSGGGNETPYIGNYVMKDPTTFALTSGGLSGCSGNKPEFVFGSNPSSASGTAEATWKLPASDCTYDTSPAKVRVTIKPAGTNAPDLTAATSDAGSSPEINCSVQLFNPLSWFLCPLATALETVVSGLDNEINNYLDIHVGGAAKCNAKDTSGSQWCDYYQSWSVVRNMSLGLIAVFSLVAIVSQAMGFELLDAYTIRKVLPRLLIAAIGITLSWPLMIWFIGLTNDLGLGVRQLIYAPFNGTQDASVSLGGGGQFVSSFFVGGAIVALGFAGLLSFVATAALAAAVAFLVLTLRQMLIVILVIFAPIAIACFVLPNTQKVWKLWSDSFMKGLLMFPIIAAFIAIGRVFAAVNSHGTGSINQIIAFTAYFAPYFLLPFAFRLAGGAVSTIAGLANDRSKGVFDRLSKGRKERMADRFQKAQNQSLWDNTSRIGKLANKGASWATDPLSNAAYHGRGVPGLRKRGNKVAFGLEHEQIEQSKKLLEEVNSTFNDKAYRAINGGLHGEVGKAGGFSEATKRKLDAAGLLGKSPQSLNDFQNMAHILQNSDEQTERIAGNALEGSAGRLATLYQDPEMGRASIAAAGMMGLASHGFLNRNDIAPATDVLKDQGGAAFAQAIGGQSQLLVARSRPDLKSGYGMDYNRSTGRMEDGLNTNGGLRGFEMFSTLGANDIAGAKGGFFATAEKGGSGDIMLDILKRGKNGDAVKASRDEMARQLAGKSDDEQSAIKARWKQTHEGQEMLKNDLAGKHYESVKRVLEQNSSQFSHGSVDVQSESARILRESGLGPPDTSNMTPAQRAAAAEQQQNEANQQQGSGPFPPPPGTGSVFK